jgi:signal transduction histidine kinase
MLDEIPRAIEQSLDGVNQVATIVRAMKAYSHPSVDMTPSDLNAAIANAITVSRNEWKYVAEVVANLDPTLPAVMCAPGQFNQVMLNLIVNAAHAIEGRADEGPRTKGLIVVSSRWTDDYVEITVEDDGCGIEPENQSRIFDPFFTTKEVGRGTGQGLSVVRDLIVKNHGGSIDVSSKPGEGSCFTIRMPLDVKEREAVA